MGTWKEEVKNALKNLGGEAKLEEIYNEFLRTTTKEIPGSYRAAIRSALERNSSDSLAYEGREDLFYCKEIGSGIWGLRQGINIIENNLKKYSKYSREEIHDIFSPNTKFTKQSGTWGMQGIIKVPNAKKDYIFLVTYGQKQANHKFEEDIDENGILTWQSQPAQGFKNKQIRDFINHNDAISNIYLFLRTDNKSKYTYLGLLSYISHDNQREKPVYFKWQILDWDEEKTKKALANLKISKSNIYKENSNKDIVLTVKESENIYYKKSDRRGTKTKEFYSNRNIDFENRDRNNNKLGEKGEKAVVKYEKEFLIKNNRPNYAKDVHRTCETNGNTEKFDVLSYELDGTPKYIEVKTTTGSANNEFHISEREVAFSERYGENYYLYRVYNLNPETMQADIIIKKGPIDREALTPTDYVCKIEVENQDQGD